MTVRDVVAWCNSPSRSRVHGYYSSQIKCQPHFVNSEIADKPFPNLLLAEDSQDDAFFFRRALLKVYPNSLLTHVGNGAAAIEFLMEACSQITKSRIPDLVFLDLKMPVLSGFDVLRWIHDWEAASLLRVIVLSGSDHIGDKNRAMELGAQDYLVKPIRPAELKKQIDTLRGAEVVSSGGVFHETGPNS